MMIFANQPSSEKIFASMPDGEKVSVTIRRYKTSRNLRLRLQDDGSIMITSPKGVTVKYILDFINVLSPKLLAARKGLLSEKKLLPETISIPLTGQFFKVHYLANPELSGQYKIFCKIIENDKELVINENPENAEKVIFSLQMFFLHKARIFLPQFIKNLAPDKIFMVKVRNQKKRMGSCSKKTDASGNTLSLPAIHLNWRAIFLPYPMLRHLCMHELAHLEYMNHSPAFYSYLDKLSPDCKKMEKSLGQAWQNLPKWVCYHKQLY